MKIFVKTLLGKTIALEVDLSNTILSVKQLIQDLEGYKSEQQKLIFAGITLQDEKILLDYNIQYESIIRLLIMFNNTDQNFRIVIRNCVSDKIFAINVEERNTILSIKEKLQDVERIPSNQQKLVFKGFELANDDYTLRDYHIPNESLFYLLIDSPNDCQIFVNKFNSDIVLTLNVKLSYTIIDIKRLIQSIEGIPVCDQALMFRGYEIEDDDKTLRHYHVNANDTFVYIYRFHKQILIKVIDGKTLFFQVKSYYTIRKLKQMIQDIEGIKPHQYRLIYSQVDLDDNNTISDYNILSESILTLIPLTIPIQIKSFSTKSMTLQVAPYVNISTIKQMIQNSHCISTKHQRIMYNGHVLNDHDRLEDCNIEVNSRLSLIPPISAIVFDGKYRSMDTLDDTVNVPINSSCINVIFEDCFYNYFRTSLLSRYFMKREVIRVTINIYKDKGNILFKQPNVLHSSNKTLEVKIGTLLEYDTLYYIEVEVFSSSEIYYLDVATFKTESIEGRLSLVMSRPGIGMTILLENFPRLSALRTIQTLRDEYFRLFSNWESVELRANRVPVFRLLLPDGSQVEIASDDMVQQLSDRDMINVIMPEDVILSNKEILDSFICPITCAVMEDPVICSDGSTYERSAIAQWLRGSNRSPTTNLVLVNKTLIPNIALRYLIQEYQQKSLIP